MKSIACAITLVGALLGCQSKESKDTPDPVGTTAPDSPYAKDIEALCEAITRSGADQGEPEARTYTVATWLGSAIQTQEGRNFLVRIQPLVGAEKASALENEAKRVGLAGCSLADEWRQPAP